MNPVRPSSLLGVSLILVAARFRGRVVAVNFGALALQAKPFGYEFALSPSAADVQQAR